MITGYFTDQMSIPEVPVGADIIATVGYYAVNPGALLWHTWVVIDSPGLGLRTIPAVLDTNETGEIGGRVQTVNLGPMPDKTVAISFFFFAHDEAGYNWDWNEYDAWLMGGPMNPTYLGSYYITLSPGTPEPVIDFEHLHHVSHRGQLIPRYPNQQTVPTEFLHKR